MRHRNKMYINNGYKENNTKMMIMDKNIVKNKSKESIDILLKIVWKIMGLIWLGMRKYFRNWRSGNKSKIIIIIIVFEWISNIEMMTEYYIFKYFMKDDINIFNKYTIYTIYR